MQSQVSCIAGDFVTYCPPREGNKLPNVPLAYGSRRLHHLVSCRNHKVRLFVVEEMAPLLRRNELTARRQPGQIQL